MVADKKKWRRPELTVLVRSRPEEAVLALCKTTGSSGPNIAAGMCKRHDKGKCIGACSQVGAS